MREIGVRELRNRLSSVLHSVEDGEQIRVTVRGKPVADIVPATARRGEEQLRELVAAGKVTPASRPRPTRAAAPVDSGRSAAAIVLAERDEER